MVVSYFGLMAGAYAVGSLGGAYFAKHDVDSLSKEVSNLIE